MIFDYFFILFDIIFNTFKNVFGLKRVSKSKLQLNGKVVVITGANTGIGKETAYQLSLRGAMIIIGCRDLNKGVTAVNHIKAKNLLADITVLKLDLSSLTSVRQFAKSVEERVTKVDILINNAGVMMCPESQTEDGFEMQFGTNHLGHFLLTLSLMPLLKKSSNARIVTLSSTLYIWARLDFKNLNLGNGAYTPMKGYVNSKLANILFTRELAKRLGPHSHIRTYSLHPGVVQTELFRHNWVFSSIMNLVKISIEMGAQTTLFCAFDESVENESGLFYDECKRVDRMLSKATDDRSAQILWEMSSDFVNLEKHLRI